MQKSAILSRHIILPEARSLAENLPVYGLVLIEDESIAEVVVLPGDCSPGQACLIYAAWNPVNCEDYYVSPGLIDCNVRGNGEWETQAELTLAAASGGVTFLARENSLYGQSLPEDSDCYCDIGTVARVDETALIPGSFALKLYLFPPSDCVPGHAADLDSLLASLQYYPGPVIVDATLPQERWLHCSSPYRCKPLSDRLGDVEPEQPKSSGAYQREISEDVDSGSEEDEPKEEAKAPAVTVKDDREVPETNDRRSRFPKITVIVEEARERSTSFKRSDKRKNSMPTIMMDLRKRINQHAQSVAEISQAEMKEYALSGKTMYSPDLDKGRKRSASFMTPQLKALSTCTPDLSPMLLPAADPVQFAERTRMKRPGMLEIVKAATHEGPDYLTFLVNSPDFWEVDGVRTVLKALERHPRQLHFANVSAATAINRILRKPLPDVTVETCPHFLCFSMEEVGLGEARLKNWPPVRNKTNCNLLWELLKVNGITVLASQHTCIPPSLKPSSFSKALSGVSGLGYSLQAVWTKLRMPAVHSQQMQDKYLIRLSKWMSLYPAKLLGVSQKRGSIEKGKWADLLVWQPFEKSTQGRPKYPQACPYSGKELYGRVQSVYVRGRLAYHEGQAFPVGSVLTSAN